MLALALLAASLLQAPSPAPRPEVQRPSRLQLQWQAPASCPDAEEVLARLRERLPSVDAPLPEHSVPLVASAVLDGGEAGFDVRIELRSGEVVGVRSFAAQDCSLLTDAAVLVIAVALDPVQTAAGVPARAPAPASVDASSPAASSPADGVPTAPVSPAVVEDAAANDAADGDASGRSPADAGPDRPAPDRPAPDRTRGDASGDAEGRALTVGLRALGGGGFGPTNQGFATIGGSLALLGRRFRVAVDGRWVVRRSVVQSNGAGGRFDAWLLGAVGCFVPKPPKRRSIELPICAGVEAGQLRAQGLPTLPVFERATQPHVALRLAPGIAWAPIERLAIGLDVELTAPLTRGTFVVDSTVVQRVAPVGVRGLLGVELRLP